MSTLLSKHFTRVLSVVLMIATSYGVAIFQHDVLRPDACLDAGAAWDSTADACVLDATLGPMPQAYPRWVFLGFGTLSVSVLLYACTSIAAAFLRRWDSARRLGRRCVLTSIGIIVGTMALAVIPTTAEQPPPWSKAMRLANGISEFMNATAVVYMAVVIGAAAWVLGAWGERRGRRQDSA